MNTPVIYRTWREGDVIALFPTLPADRCGVDCQSYQHIGQHGAANYHGVMKCTRPATKAEIEPLRRELESIGYDDLIPYLRAPYRMHEQRRS